MDKTLTSIDISILKKQPQLNVRAIFEVQPLAPLSMVSELPGSYYKTLRMPDKKMICGLFENLLGWHIDLADRKAISKEVKQLREKVAKQYKKQKDTLFEADEPIVQFIDYTKGSTFMPLLMDYFDIQDIQPVISKVVFYDDLWSKAYRRADAAKTHIGGTSNISYEIIAQKNDALAKSSDDELNAFFKNNLGNFPLYYSTPTVREFIAMEGKFDVFLNLDAELNTMLQKQILSNNLCFLGNSEGWVDLKIKEL